MQTIIIHFTNVFHCPVLPIAGMRFAYIIQAFWDVGEVVKVRGSFYQEAVGVGDGLGW